MLKKILSIALCIAMVFTLFACSGNSTMSSDSSSSSNSNGNLKTQIQNCTPLVDYSGNTKIEQMDTVTFGLDSKSEPIEWLILEKNNNKALLLSKYVLDKHRYNDINERIDITWEYCTCRKWLNSEFLNSVFNKKEQGAIIVTDLVNNDNVEYGTKGGNNTKDKIFLLSIDEFNKYFETQDVRAYDINDKTDDEAWLLRSPGREQHMIAYVGYWGLVDYGDGSIDEGAIRGIRPAMWVKY